MCVKDKEKKRETRRMKEFNKSSSNLVVFAMASIFLVSAIFVTNINGYHKAMTWFVSPTRSEISTSQDYSSTSSIMDHQNVSNRAKHRDEKLERLQAGLASARAYKRGDEESENRTLSDLEDADYVPRGEIYRNAYAFDWISYLLMEKLLKIFMYEEGEPPIFHNGRCKDIYSMEGLFLSFMESEHSRHFKTRDPDGAHVFFLPLSVEMIVEYLFDPIIPEKAVLQCTVVDYVQTISRKYPYWNRSLGADHLLLP